jgi:hypothetical protein
VQDAECLVYNLAHITSQMIIIQLPLSSSLYHSLQIYTLRIHLRITNRTHSINMKWLLALLPVVAAMPALPSQELADAPPAGSVRLRPYQSQPQVS